tara:strand:- start:1046 stop:3406 length:2361 start_codon:yes stop_codon:yes gene_type:complete
MANTNQHEDMIESYGMAIPMHKSECKVDDGGAPSDSLDMLLMYSNASVFNFRSVLQKRASCGLLEDKLTNSQCRRWVKRGNCSSSNPYMKATCAYSCCVAAADEQADERVNLLALYPENHFVLNASDMPRNAEEFDIFIRTVSFDVTLRQGIEILLRNIKDGQEHNMPTLCGGLMVVYTDGKAHAIAFVVREHIEGRRTYPVVLMCNYGSTRTFKYQASSDQIVVESDLSDLARSEYASMYDDWDLKDIRLVFTRSPEAREAQLQRRTDTLVVTSEALLKRIAIYRAIAQVHANITPKRHRTRQSAREDTALIDETFDYALSGHEPQEMFYMEFHSYCKYLNVFHYIESLEWTSDQQKEEVIRRASQLSVDWVGLADPVTSPMMYVDIQNFTEDDIQVSVPDSFVLRRKPNDMTDTLTSTQIVGSRTGEVQITIPPKKFFTWQVAYNAVFTIRRKIFDEEYAEITYRPNVDNMGPLQQHTVRASDWPDTGAYVEHGTADTLSSIRDLTHLKGLVIGPDDRIVEIPESISNLTQLKILGIQNTRIVRFPDPLPTQLTNLKVERNYKLTGPIPDSIGDLTRLTQLKLHNNSELAGPIPDSIGNLTRLAKLDLSYNRLTGPIPDSIGNLTLLTVLNLSDNGLTGPIPTSIGNLTRLTMLNVADNQLTGPIPTWIGNLTRLTKLWLGSNQLTGSIPDSIGNLTQLNFLTLSNNQLTGSIPESIRNLDSLELVTLAERKRRSNQFTLENWWTNVSNVPLKNELERIRESGQPMEEEKEGSISSDGGLDDVL